MAYSEPAQSFVGMGDSRLNQQMDRSEHQGRLRFSLVFPPFDDKRDRSAYYVAPPLGLLSIAAYLTAAGHSVAIEDFVFDLKSGRLSNRGDIYGACAERIVSARPDVVGFGTQCSTGPGSINIARRIKQLDPSIVVLLGGHDVSFLAPAYLRAFPEVDLVLAGEAELTAPKLAEALGGTRSLRDVAGLTFRDRGKFVSNGGEERVTDLDSMLPPRYDLVSDLEEYFEHSRRPTILVDSGRGCAFACEFCQTTLLNGRKVRYRSVPSLIAELEGHVHRYDEYEAYFVHDLFTARRKFVEELCHGLIDSGLDISWQCRCRIDQVSPDLLALMSRAGCRMLLYGIESGSEATLAQMNKRFRRGVAAETTERVRWTVDSGIFPSLSMVVGIPEEKLEDLEATMVLATEFVKIGRVNAFIQLMSPLPGTALAARVADRLEYRGEDAPTAFSQGIEFAGGRRLAEDEQLIRGWPAIFQPFYTVAPDHGDLDICVDVSLTYCKLLEVYCWSFLALADELDIGLLELFRRYRDHVSAGRIGNRGLTGIKDFEIWRGFRSFAADTIEGRTISARLGDSLRFEQLVHDISVAIPVVQAEAQRDPEDGEAFTLHPAARVFRSRTGLPWSGSTDPRDGEKSFLLFMGPDRLEIVALTPELAEALELLDELSRRRLGTPHHYRTLARALAPLERLAVLTRVEEAVAMGAPT